MILVTIIQPEGSLSDRVKYAWLDKPLAEQLNLKDLNGIFISESVDTEKVNQIIMLFKRFGLEPDDNVKEDLASFLMTGPLLQPLILEAIYLIGW